MRTDDIRSSVAFSGIKLSTGRTYGPVGTYVEPSYKRSRSEIVKNSEVDGFRAPSPYKCTLVQTTYGRGGFEAANVYYNPPRTASYRGGAFPNGTPIAWTSEIPKIVWDSTASLVDQSVIKARNSIANRTAAFSETIAEARSTLAGLADNAATVTAVSDDLINTRWKAALRKLRVKPGSPDWNRTLRASKKGFRNFSDAWLTYWFGLSPIVDDMVQGLAYFSGDEIFRKLRVKGSAYVPIAEQTLREETGATGGLAYAIAGPHVVAETKIEGGVYTSLWFDIDSSKLRELTKFGLVDIPSTAWAVAPWSFAIDWVIPVSEVLKSLTATIGLTYKGGSSTRFARSKVTFPYAKYRFNYQSSQKWVDQGSYLNFPDLDGLRMDRQVYTSEPNPIDLWVKDPLDAWTATTALSLLAQRLKFFKT